MADSSPRVIKLPQEFFQKLPKTDLHVHLDGSMRVETIIDLARIEKVALPAPDADGLRAILKFVSNYGSLVEYLKTFDVTLSVLIAGFKSSFQPFHVKQATLRRINHELKRFIDDGRELEVTGDADRARSSSEVVAS